MIKPMLTFTTLLVLLGVVVQILILISKISKLSFLGAAKI